MLKRRAFLNDLTRHEAYLCSHLREISKRCRISSVLIRGIIDGRQTWIDASDAEISEGGELRGEKRRRCRPRLNDRLQSLCFSHVHWRWLHFQRPKFLSSDGNVPIPCTLTAAENATFNDGDTADSES
jgi:hypothetical protein